MARDKNDKMSLPMDYAIKPSKVRLVNDDGTTEIMHKNDAVERAKSQGKNLVQVAFNPALFPGSICKIMDYAKFKYDEKKRQKEQQKKMRAAKTDLKEVKFTIRCDDGDKNLKVRHIREFLEEGDLVKVTIVLARRETSKVDYAKSFMKSILANFDGLARIDGTPSFEGRILSCTLKKA